MNLKEAFTAMLEDADACRRAAMTDNHRRVLKSKLRQENCTITDQTMRSWLVAAGWTEFSMWTPPAHMEETKAPA